MSCISTSVGLGNVWRFPFVAYENGGGAFLIPYIIVLFVIGKPLYYMEMILGQFTSRSSIKMYEMSPLFRGACKRNLVFDVSSEVPIVYTYLHIYLWIYIYGFIFYCIVTAPAVHEINKTITYGPSTKTFSYRASLLSTRICEDNFICMSLLR